MIKANGARLEWQGYEYGRMVGGEIVETGDYDVLRARQNALGLPGSIVFRAKYVTEWMAAGGGTVAI